MTCLGSFFLTASSQAQGGTYDLGKWEWIMDAPSAAEKYPNIYFVSKVGMTPFLLWHPKDTNTTNNAHLY